MELEVSKNTCATFLLSVQKTHRIKQQLSKTKTASNSNWASAEEEMHKQRQYWCKQNPEKSTQAILEQFGRLYEQVHIKMMHLNKETAWQLCRKTTNESISLSIPLPLPPSLPHPPSLPSSLFLAHSGEKEGNIACKRQIITFWGEIYFMINWNYS